VDKNTLKIEDGTPEGKIITGENIMIATGSMPNIPDFEGGEYCDSSDGVFKLENLPKKMVVVGGG